MLNVYYRISCAVNKLTDYFHVINHLKNLSYHERRFLNLNELNFIRSFVANSQKCIYACTTTISYVCLVDTFWRCYKRIFLVCL